jgi:hypothetical protein
MSHEAIQATMSHFEHEDRVTFADATRPSDIEASPGFEALQISGVAPNILRELSGIYPTFVSAFKELVSNAYDADATLVTIQLSPDLSTITVEDNGAGMTPFEFQNEYIRIGGSAQRRDEDLTPGGRRPIGCKGIGFLAAARYCHQVEIHSHTDRVVTFCENVVLEPQSSPQEPRRLPFFQGLLAHALMPFTTVQAMRCRAVELAPAKYGQDGLTIELSAEAWRRFRGQTLTVQYTVDFRAVDMQATIDYDYLLGLEDDRSLETLQDFCRIRLVPNTNVTKPAPSAGSGKLSPGSRCICTSLPSASCRPHNDGAGCGTWPLPAGWTASSGI